MTRSFVALLCCVLAAGITALAWATDGFRVVTSAGARQLAVERHPRPLPEVSLVDQDGKSFALSDYRGGTVLVDFIYARCPTICSVLGDDFQRALALWGASGLDRKANLLSISFDPANDDREALKLYGERYGAVAPAWRIAAPTSARGLAALLRAFEVVVIPDGMGGFIHNSAVYLIDAQGRLARIIDPDGPQPLAAEVAPAATP